MPGRTSNITVVYILKHSLRICTGLMRVLYALCFNNDAQTIDYCLEEGGGLDVLKRIFEKVASAGKFTLELAESIFNIIELPTLSGSQQLRQFVPELMQRLVFNLYIWASSDHVVQVKESNVNNLR